MRRLVIGTTNPGKVRQLAGALSAIPDLECIPIGELATDLPDIDEVGESAEEVAAVKAHAYSAAIDQPVLSLDHWLRFPEAADADQPLGRVRRIPGNEHGAGDDEVISHYRRLSERYGGRLTAEWHLGVAHARAGQVRSTRIIARRRLVARPSATRMPGLPLSALQIDLETGRYISEHEAEDEIALWQRTYGPDLVRFVTSCIEQ